MPERPHYRLRLFLSVDLVGSTAFKARFGDAREGHEPNPLWVTQIRHFYREFPKFLTQRYFRTVATKEIYASYQMQGPCTWKTIGDEILFCCRIETLEHLACCVTAFLGALDDYGSYLDSSGRKLDVKGSGWIAAFPAPNITVEVTATIDGERDQIDEDFERRADNEPAKFDFLGKEIDSGFRAAKYATADRFTPSIELAWLLSDAAHLQIFMSRFSYHGRQSLKGVIGDRPYPIISIDSERSPSRRELKERERALTGETDAAALHLRDFLKSFMAEVEVDFPVLGRHGEPLADGQLPKCYNDFRVAWEATAQENAKRLHDEIAAADEGAGGDLPAELEVALDSTVARAEGE